MILWQDGNVVIRLESNKACRADQPNGTSSKERTSPETAPAVALTTPMALRTSRIAGPQIRFHSTLVFQIPHGTA